MFEAICDAIIDVLAITGLLLIFAAILVMGAALIKVFLFLLAL